MLEQARNEHTYVQVREFHEHPTYQHVQGGAGASGPRGWWARRAERCVGMPTHLPYSKCLSVSGGDLNFGRDNDGQVEGTVADGGWGVGCTIR